MVCRHLCAAHVSVCLYPVAQLTTGQVEKVCCAVLWTECVVSFWHVSYLVEVCCQVTGAKSILLEHSRYRASCWGRRCACSCSRWVVLTYSTTRIVHVGTPKVLATVYEAVLVAEAEPADIKQ